MKSHPTHRLGSNRECVPTLKDIQLQREYLVSELGVNLSDIDEVFNREYENVARIFRETSNLLSLKSISNITQLKTSFSDVNFVEALGRIMGISASDPSGTGNYCELPLFDTSRKSYSILTHTAIDTYFVLSDFHRKVESIRLMQSLSSPGLMERQDCIDKLVKLTQICTRLQGWVSGCRGTASRVFLTMANDDDINRKFAQVWSSLPSDTTLPLSLKMNHASIPPSVLGEDFHVLSNHDLHNQQEVLDAFSRLLCFSKSDNFAQFCGQGKEYLQGENSILPWVPLLERHMDKMIDHDSALSQVFCFIFQIQGSMFDDRGNIKKAVIQSPYIPDDIKQYLLYVLAPIFQSTLSQPIAFTRDVELERERDAINGYITHILNNELEGSPARKEISALEKKAISLTGEIQKLSESVRHKAMAPMLSAQEWHQANKIPLLLNQMKCVQDCKKEPTAINFSSVIQPWPIGVTVKIQRKKNGDKSFGEFLTIVEQPDQDGNIIVPPINADLRGKLTYRITFTVDETGEFELDPKGVPIREKSAELVSEYIDTTPNSIGTPVSVKKEPTLTDTQDVWRMALQDFEDALKYDFDEKGGVTISIDPSLVEYLHDPTYSTAIVTTENNVNIGDDLGSEIVTQILAFVERIRQEKHASELSDEEIRVFLDDSQRMSNIFGPVFDVLSGHIFQPLTPESDGIAILNAFEIPEGSISHKIIQDVGSVCEMGYNGIVFRYVVGRDNILAPVQIITSHGLVLSPGEQDGLKPLMNLFAKTVFYYTHADEKWRRKVLKEQGEHQKIEKTYFQGLSAGDRKRVIRMHPHLARQPNFPQDEDIGIVFEEDQESLKDPQWSLPDEQGRQLYYLFRLSSVTFNGVDVSNAAQEKRKKIRTSPLARSIIMDRIGRTLRLGGKREPIVPTEGREKSAGHALKELIVSDKYKLSLPQEQIAHPDLFSDFMDLIDRDGISVSFVPALVKAYDPKRHPTAD